ncbi:Vacuolar protein sorting-associated protein 13 [Vigna unguiculata]|uniref:Vacuolar protein sorting-associated protein 13 n=1 Tax=Vigna unguiculata TaxID=3917 RepID=A0A4D6L7G7_VIGUN|nr:Vacuolar protein sorting-associated protein 13 [Vigna unguiculata]
MRLVEILLQQQKADSGEINKIGDFTLIEHGQPSMLDNRLEKLDGNTPQYSVTAELSGLISLDEVQLQHMCLVCDYICTCRLREKYGRFRPWHCLLPRKCEGWQIFWWHYAQQSVLSYVRRKLKKTSWRYFGDRFSSFLSPPLDYDNFRHYLI